MAIKQVALTCDLDGCDRQADCEQAPFEQPQMPEGWVILTSGEDDFFVRHFCSEGHRAKWIDHQGALKAPDSRVWVVIYTQRIRYYQMLYGVFSDLDLAKQSIEDAVGHKVVWDNGSYITTSLTEVAGISGIRIYEQTLNYDCAGYCIQEDIKEALELDEARNQNPFAPFL